MKFSPNLVIRIIGMGVFAYIGNALGILLSTRTPNADEILATQLLTLAGAGLGLLTTPRWTITPLGAALQRLEAVPIGQLAATVSGLLLGLLAGALLAIPLGLLASPLGTIVPITLALLLAYVAAQITTKRRRDLAGMLRDLRRPIIAAGPKPRDERRHLLDTSAIIDGRIAEVARTGFIDGTILVPQFVLNELQMLADSAEEMRRARGRRGLAILNQMRAETRPPLEVIDVHPNPALPVDENLMLVARHLRLTIITNDHNLGQVASMHDVTVLNLNQLADAVRPPVVSGQTIQVIVRDVGREREQGVAFLEDGTLVVIEDARHLIGREIAVVVTRIYQTQTGRVVFAMIQPGDRLRTAPRSEERTA